MLSHILKNFGKTHASKRSYNNHIGVPITLSTLPADCDFAIQEMGMNAAGEIASLSSLTLPNIAMITRIANAHSGFFETMEDIAAAKALRALYEKCRQMDYLITREDYGQKLPPVSQ